MFIPYLINEIAQVIYNGVNILTGLFDMFSDLFSVFSETVIVMLINPPLTTNLAYFLRRCGKIVLCDACVLFDLSL